MSEGEVLTETEGARSTDPVHQSKERRADCRTDKRVESVVPDGKAAGAEHLPTMLADQQVAARREAPRPLISRGKNSFDCQGIVPRPEEEKGRIRNQNPTTYA